MATVGVGVNFTGLVEVVVVGVAVATDGVAVAVVVAVDLLLPAVAAAAPVAVDTRFFLEGREGGEEPEGTKQFL